MYELFARTLSQGLQAFLPIAAYLVWVQRDGRKAWRSATRWGIAAAIPLTVYAGSLFQRTAYQARWEALLAWIATTLALAFTLAVWRPTRGGTAAGAGRHLVARQIAVASGVALVLVRQTMEIAVVFNAAVIELRALQPTTAIVGGIAVAAATSVVWTSLGKEFSRHAMLTATRTFALLFLAQVAFYAVHESAEAGFLPWSELLHAATEPYGPDSSYGPTISYLLFLLPMAVVAMSAARGIFRRSVMPRFRLTGYRRAGAAGAASIVVAAVAFAVMTPRAARPVSSAASLAPSPKFMALAAAPHVVFRQTSFDANYGMLSVASLVEPNTVRAVDPGRLRCERVSFAAGRGICLQADRGVMTNYRAVLFNERLELLTSLKLDGNPSRTRISRDGRVGAITVFLTGHGYASGGYSTRTTLVDMSSGDVIADLEKFSTWRDGQRFSADDFNFWGVTFAPDGNTFYASLRTAGRTYLVRGDLGLRKFTVLKENVECPSLSPDGRRIAFKKKVRGEFRPWNFFILDVETMRERPLAAEERSVDDQIEWLDDGHVLYAAQRSSQSAAYDIWVAPVDGNEPARVFMHEAESPIIVR